jgi:hypothetical protein
MTGVEIVGAVLAEHAPLLAIVDVDNMKAGALPDGITLPALLLRTVSSIDRQFLKTYNSYRVTDRVSATVRAASYADQIKIIGIVKRCCGGLTGDIGGGLRVTILTAGTGPDMAGPANSFEQAQDFRVQFDEPARGE